MAVKAGLLAIAKRRVSGLDGREHGGRLVGKGIGDYGSMVKGKKRNRWPDGVQAERRAIGCKVTRNAAI